MLPVPTDTALLGSAKVKKIIDVGDMSLWRWIKAGAFPKPIKIQRHNYWRVDEINAWIAERSAARDAT